MNGRARCAQRPFSTGRAMVRAKNGRIHHLQRRIAHAVPRKCLTPSIGSLNHGSAVRLNLACQGEAWSLSTLKPTYYNPIECCRSAKFDQLVDAAVGNCRQYVHNELDRDMRDQSRGRINGARK